MKLVLTDFFVLSLLSSHCCPQDLVNMYCDLCKTRKLRREFPLDTVTEKCDHAPLHCLRVSIKLKVAQNNLHMLDFDGSL